MLTHEEIRSFRTTVLEYYTEHNRKLAWRLPEADDSFDPYKIMVSEIMLQQTQVPRVIEKYRQFLELFPTVEALTESSLSEVLAAWQGLGYNRRARFLREAALAVVNDYGGIFPRSLEGLVTLPGIGKNTAAAILVYTFNEPLVFIETNIRSVYLHHFFGDEEAVDDNLILRLVTETLDHENPREWYWALMDYGTYIKKTHDNPNRRSRHYTKQSQFEGSARQVRGQVLRVLAESSLAESKLAALINDERLDAVLEGLVKDKLIQRSDGKVQIAE